MLLVRIGTDRAVSRDSPLSESLWPNCSDAIVTVENRVRGEFRAGKAGGTMTSAARFSGLRHPDERLLVRVVLRVLQILVRY